MSDFDTVLERLLADPSFAAALAADPARALAGYRLGPDEVALLHSQVTGDAGGQGTVETRANQSSVFGLLGPLSGLAGTAGSLDEPGGGRGFGAAPPPAGEGFGPAPPPAGEGFGPASEHGGRGAGFGAALPPAREGFGAAAYRDGFGAVADQQGFGSAEPRQGAVEPAAVQLPEDYHTRVDADGDGTWDRHRLRGGPSGVDILVDTDSDGRVDFIGHDRDGDGLVDSADYDRDGDGYFERRLYDLDGDGLLDSGQG